MSNFGFNSSDEDPDKKKDQGGDGTPGGFGFGGEGFDPAALGQMLTQFGQMLSGMGAPGAGGASAGPVNYDLAKQLARQQIGNVSPIGAGKAEAVSEAAHLA